MSPASASVAVTAAPTFWPAAVFSAISRDTFEELNTGAVLVLAAAVTVPDEGYAALVRISTPLSSSVKLTFTLTFLPSSSSVRV